jgi:hypothetical protein
VSRPPVLHVPTGREGDGSLSYAPHGHLQVADGGRAVVCHTCGEPLTAITAHHVRRHGLDLAAYRRRYGLNRKQGLLSPVLSEQRAAEGARRYATNDEVRRGLAAGQAMAQSGLLRAVADTARRTQETRQQSRLRVRDGLAVARQRSREAATTRLNERAQQLGHTDLPVMLQRTSVEARQPVAQIATALGIGETQLRLVLERHGFSRRNGRAQSSVRPGATRTSHEQEDL